MEGDKLSKIKRHWFCHSRLKKDEIEWLIRQVELKQEIEEGDKNDMSKTLPDRIGRAFCLHFISQPTRLSVRLIYHKTFLREWQYKRTLQ